MDEISRSRSRLDELHELAEAVKGTEGATSQQQTQIDSQVANVEESYASLEMTASQIGVNILTAQSF